jgi:hypothetical protein
VSAGEIAALADASSRAAVTSRCTTAWVPPASGTWLGIPVLRTAALISAIRHRISCTQASQTTTERILSTEKMSSCWVKVDRLGSECGIGSPTTVTSATGTPMASSASAITAVMPASTSVKVRRRGAGRRNCGIGGAISNPPPGESRIRRTRSRAHAW